MNVIGKTVRTLAQRWGVTEGQLYTAVIGLVVALAAAVGGIPPTLADRPVETTTDTPLTTRTTHGVPAPGAGTGAADEPLPPLALALPLPFSGASAPLAFTPAPAPAPGPAGAPVRDPDGSFRVVATVPEPGAPQGIVSLPDGRVLVATNNGSGRGVDGAPVLFVFAGEGAPRRITLGSVAAGQGVHDLVLPRGGDGRVVYALASQPSAVLRVDVDAGTASSHAAIPDIPPCARTAGQSPCELSPVDQAPTPVAATFDAAGTMFVADAAQGVVWRIGADRVATLFFRAPQFVALDGLSGVAAAAGGVLYLSVAQAPAASGAGVVYRLSNDTLREFARTDSGDLPRGVTLGRSGKLYVALAGAGRVLVLNRDGSRAGLLPTADTGFDTPVRATFGPTALLVVEQAPTRPRAGRIVALGVNDAGA